MAQKKPAKKSAGKPAKKSPTARKGSSGFAAEEKAAMREYVRERKAAARRRPGTKDEGEEDAVLAHRLRAETADRGR